MRPSRRQLQPFVRRWPAGRPSATALAVALSIGAYAAQLIVHYFLVDHASGDLFPQWLALDAQGIQHGQWWKFATFGLLHVTPLHLIANMALLFFAGRELEPIVGPRHFLAIYGVGNLLGGIFHWAVMDPLVLNQIPLTGVAAGVAAVVVAYTSILPELEVTANLFFVIPLHLCAKHLAYALMGVCILCWSNHTGLEMGPAGMLAGAIFGWAYVKQLGFGNPLPIQKYIFDKRQRAARLERMSAEQFLATEMDPILEKIAQQGMKSLTRAEKKILEQGRGKLSGNTGVKG
jgi:membrane associated rhomboid family serine protease